jgi:hypothetical protein
VGASGTLGVGNLVVSVLFTRLLMHCILASHHRMTEDDMRNRRAQLLELLPEGVTLPSEYTMRQVFDVPGYGSVQHHACTTPKDKVCQ